mmetsp:Transcript_58411/g.122006  ORF Transcript_58411/g.122006 Transcript_58411/m.122006 type:complete len:224 (-) Transcript_58411:1254-1925(-)
MVLRSLQKIWVHSLSLQESRRRWKSRSSRRPRRVSYFRQLLFSVRTTGRSCVSRKGISMAVESKRLKLQLSRSLMVTLVAGGEEKIWISGMTALKMKMPLSEVGSVMRKEVREAEVEAKGVAVGISMIWIWAILAHRQPPSRRRPLREVRVFSPLRPWELQRCSDGNRRQAFQANTWQLVRSRLRWISFAGNVESWISRHLNLSSSVCTLELRQSSRRLLVRH